MKIENLRDLLMDILSKSENNELCFSESVTKKDLIAQIIFELIKKYYHSKLPFTSLRQYVNSTIERDSLLFDAHDALYEQTKRNHRQAAKAKEQLFRQIQPTSSDVPPVEGINTMRDRLNGYRYNSLQMKQMENYGNLDVVTALWNGQMASSKKISRDRFKAIYQDYDIYIQTLIDESTKSHQQSISNAIDFYDLQLRMNIELTYFFAKQMEQFKFDKFPAFEASIIYSGICGDGILLQNRFLLRRESWASYVFGEKNAEYRLEKDRLMKLLVLKYNVMEALRKSISSWDFELEEMAEFIQTEYNPFSTYNKSKEWSNKRIDLTRKVIYSMWVSPV